MGVPLFPQAPFAPFPGGVDLGTVLVNPTGANVIYCRSTGPQSADAPALSGRLVSTLSAALAQCRSGLADTVMVLPGHTESVTAGTFLANLVPGTRIVGVGRGSKMPTFRWTNTAGSWALDDADVVISGLRLRMEGANGITKGITITAADVLIHGCDIEVASGAALKAAIAIEIGAGGDRAEIAGNIFRGTATHNVTDGVLVAAAVDGVRICDNEMIFSATAANGNIRTSAAATNIKILRNTCYNTHTASTACIAFGNQAVDGVCDGNVCGTVNNGTVTDQGITFGGAALIRCGSNLSVDEPKKSGTLTPAAGT